MATETSGTANIVSWTEAEVWTVIAEAGVRGLHKRINQALADAYKKGMEDGRWQIADGEPERDPGRAA
jgi:hypothetical protein